MKRTSIIKALSLLIAIAMALMPMAGISALANGNEFTITYEFDPDFPELGETLDFPYERQTEDGLHYVVDIEDLIGGPLPEGYTFHYWVDSEDIMREPGDLLTPKMS